MRPTVRFALFAITVSWQSLKYVPADAPVHPHLPARNNRDEVKSIDMPCMRLAGRFRGPGLRRRGNIRTL